MVLDRRNLELSRAYLNPIGAANQRGSAMTTPAVDSEIS